MPHSHRFQGEAVASPQAMLEPYVPGGIATIQPLSRGHNATLLRVVAKDGREWVAKCASQPGAADMALEGWMLTYLAEKGLRVPRLLHATADWLLMELLPDSGVMHDAVQRDAAHQLARLHRVEGNVFGLERDTVIGPLHQPNSLTSDWAAFYGEHRLHYMAQNALSEGQIDVPIIQRLERLITRLPEWLDQRSTPRLIHGDLWGGNVLAEGDRISGFIDPAIYYADPEVELAFTTMFHTFGEVFYREYAAMNPIADGFWDCRRHLYLLYPILVHVRIYGAGYVGQLLRVLDRFV